MKKVLYWLISLTWGALLTIPGLIVSGICVAFLHGKMHKNGFGYIIEIGGNWGGFNLGCISLCGSYSQKDGPCYDIDWYEHTRRHEFGHSIQQLIFGPLQLFIVVIPSVIRYWYQRSRDAKGLPNKEYDSIWFEGTATSWGTKCIEAIEK